jgi:hypothetical protein
MRSVCYFEDYVLLGYDAGVVESSVPDVSKEPNTLIFKGVAVLALHTLEGGPTLRCASSLSIHIIVTLTQRCVGLLKVRLNLCVWLLLNRKYRLGIDISFQISEE